MDIQRKIKMLTSWNINLMHKKESFFYTSDLLKLCDYKIQTMIAHDEKNRDMQDVVLQKMTRTS